MNQERGVIWHVQLNKRHSNCWQVAARALYKAKQTTYFQPLSKSSKPLKLSYKLGRQIAREHKWWAPLNKGRDRANQVQQKWWMPCYFFYELNITCTLHKLTNTQKKNWQLCLCLKGTKGGSFGSNARLLSLGIIFTGCCCRWRNIHLSSAKNFSNNPVLMSAQGPGRIQPNLNRNNPAIIKKKLLDEKTIFCKYKGST